MKIPLPTPTGYNDQYINAGNIQNKGIEIVINATPVTSRDFNWDIALNFALNRNKVIRLADKIKTVYYGGGDNPSATPQVSEGGSFCDLIAYQWAKNVTGRHEVNAKGAPLTTDILGQQQGLIGNFNPKENLGLTNTFRYK